MMCQHCQKNEATNQFTVNFMGTEHEVHLCDECTAQLSQWAGAMQRQMAAGGSAPWWYSAVQAAGSRQEPPFPHDAGDSVKSRRRMIQLRGRMQRAIRMEQYELAARLRDEITALEQEVLKNESALSNL